MNGLSDRLGWALFYLDAADRRVARDGETPERLDAVVASGQVVGEILAAIYATLDTDDQDLAIERAHAFADYIRRKAGT